MGITMEIVSDLNTDQAEKAAQNAEVMAAMYREELVNRIARAVPKDGKIEHLKGMHLARVSSVGEPFHGVSFPSFCVIAQGVK